MIKGLILASYGAFSGGALGNLFAQWESAGVFSYMLPFLLIFAVIFGLLTRINIFTQKGEENKPNNAINAIIALAVSLMAMQFNFVSVFFSEIFPRLGVGLAILLIAIILLSLFMPKEKWVDYVFFGIGAIILVVILMNTAGSVGFFGGGFLSMINWYAWGPLIVIIVVILIIVAVSVPKKSGEPSSKAFKLIQE